MGTLLPLTRDERGGTAAVELLIVFTLVVLAVGVGARLLGESERASFVDAGGEVSAATGDRERETASLESAAAAGPSTDTILLAYVGAALLCFVAAHLLLAGLRRLLRRHRRAGDDEDEPDAGSAGLRFGALEAGGDAIPLGEGDLGVE